MHGDMGDTRLNSSSVAPAIPAAMHPAGRYLMPESSNRDRPCMVKRGYDKLDNHRRGASFISLIRM